MDIRIYDKNFKLVWLLDTYESLIWTIRYQECGDFEIMTKPTESILTYITPGCYLQIKESDRTMVVENMKISNDYDNGDRLLISGRSLESILDRRVVWKDATFKNTSINNVIKSLITNNFTNPPSTQPSARKVSNFLYVESPLTKASTKMSANYRGNNIYDVVIDILKANKLGMKLLLEDKKFKLYLYEGEDRTRDQSSNQFVLFSPGFDNLLNSNYSKNFEPYKTTALIGGEDPDKGKSREYISYNLSSAITGIDRREMYVDGSGIKSQTDEKDSSGNYKQMTSAEYRATLKSKAKEELNKKHITSIFDGDVDYSGMFKLYTNFNIGDIVEVEDKYGNGMKARIGEIIISDDVSDGIKIYPSFTNIEEGEEEST